VARGVIDDEQTRLWRAARAEWPTVEVTGEEFAAYVRERRAEDGDDARGTDPARGSDLYLACACARGDEDALAAFEAAFFAEIDAAARRVGGPSVDELRQVLRHRLFVADPGERPKIVEFTGRGALRVWVRIAAMRTALNLALRGAREVALEGDALAVLVGGGDDPELTYMKRLYTDAFKTAFKEAFAALGSRERNLLRYAFGKGLTVDAIGSLYGVHRATAARWVAHAHARLIEKLRTALASSIGQKDLASVLRMLDGRLQITLDRYLNGTVE
jgi:RNA polymerase sigma-70 factor (ECF subfamily)